MNSKTTEKIAGRSLFFNKEIVSVIFKFCASLQLAVGTLVTLMIVLAVGTIIESRYSADAAKILVYGAPWFSLILIVLVINLACSAADRLPWQKKHIGFVLTHIGIITILAGSMATQTSAVDGQMMLDEGASGKWVTLKQPMLYLYSQGFKEEKMLSVKERAFKWKGRERLYSTVLDKALPASAENKALEIVMTQFWPKTNSETKWVPATEGPAAIQVTLHNQRMNVTQWVADEALSREIQMGPATLKFSAELIAQPENGGGNYFEIQRGDEKLQMPVPEKSALPFEKVFEKGLKVKVLEVYAYAYVEENVLKEGSAAEHAENPAAELEIQVDDKKEKHTVFANFPDFPTVHGRPNSALGLTAQYRRSNSGSKGESHELRFVATPSGIQYQIQTGAKLQQGPVEVGREIATGWMDLQFRVEQALPHAASDLNVLPLEDDDKSELAASATEIEIKVGDEVKKFWTVEGIHKKLIVDGGLFEIILGRKQLPLGFEIALKDFRVKNDPGTNRPASFESDVVLKDFARGVSLEKTISMNQPLAYRGFKLYQAGYTPNPGGADVSVFAVGRDPGVPVKYAGAIIMVLGILLMFYTRPYSTRNEKGLT